MEGVIKLVGSKDKHAQKHTAEDNKKAAPQDAKNRFHNFDSIRHLIVTFHLLYTVLEKSQATRDFRILKLN